MEKILETWVERIHKLYDRYGMPNGTQIPYHRYNGKSIVTQGSGPTKTHGGVLDWQLRRTKGRT